MIVFILLSIFSVLNVIPVLLATSTERESEVLSILDYVKEQDENFHVGSQKNVIMVFGAAGSGKSTLTSLITDADLESVAIKNGFRIIDRDNNIDNLDNENTPTAVIPNVMTDEQNGVTFYDCPPINGFNDVNKELAGTFAIRKLLNFAESIKFLFAMSMNPNHNSHDILNLVQFATGLIKDIEKYCDAIALVVTNVPNKSMEGDDQDDGMEIESIAELVRQTKNDLVKRAQFETISSDEKQAIDRQILFLDILLTKNLNEYPKIGMLRSATHAGPLTEMPLIQREKSIISNIVNKNLRFVYKEDTDFGYVISAKSKGYVDDIVKVLNGKLVAEFDVINSDIRRFLLQKEKHTSNSLNESIAAVSLIDQKLSQIISTEPIQFAMQLTSFVDTLAVSLSSRNFNKFLDWIKFADFVQLFGKNELQIPMQISSKIDTQREYLRDSQLWYSFLIQIRDKLSEYSAQSTELDQGLLMNLTINGENTERIVSDLEIQSTINQIDANIYSTIQHLHVNPFKLKLLQGIWGQSLQRPSKKCSSDGKHLIVEGFNVRISDVLQSDCWGIATEIEVFALNKLFLDADIDRASIYLSIISPVWEIVLNDEQSRRIKLIGNDGEVYSSHAKRGEHGVPGMPGSRGGQFFGIGWAINDHRLEINVNGGKGGNGQDGGQGFDGVKGYEVPKSTDIDFLLSLGTKYSNDSLKRKESEYSVIHHFYGLPAKSAGSGGSGGCKGFGGNSGDVQIFGIKTRSNIVLLQQKGENGEDGKGGLGGAGAANGRNFHIEIHHFTPQAMILQEIKRPRRSWYEGTGTQPAGKNGKDGENCYEIQANSFYTNNPLESLHRYKYYAREQFASNVQISNLNQFLDYIRKNDGLNALFNTTDLINEFQNIDNHYFKLRDVISFIPHYESLRERVAAHSHSLNGQLAEQKALNYLYTAILSRLFAIQSHSNQIGVVNLLEYIKVVEKQMTKLQQVKRTVYINEYRDEFKSSLDSKIESGSKLIQNTIIPRIDRLFTKTDEKIRELLDETFAKGNETQKVVEKVKENRTTLKIQMIGRAVIHSLRIVGSMLSGLGPVGMFAGKAIDAGTGFADNVINSTFQLHSITVPSGLMQTNVFHVAEQAKHDFELLKMQLTDLRAVLNDEGLSDFDSILRTVNISIVEMKRVTETSEIPSIDKIELVQETRKNLTTLIDNAQKTLDEYEDKESVLVARASKSLEYMEKILSVGDAGLLVYHQIHNDRKKIDAVDELIRTLDTQLTVIKQHELNIYNIMIPQFKMIEQSVNEALKSSAGKSHVELVVTKWMVQNSLQKVQKLFKLMAQEFHVETELERCMEKINEGITTAIDIYDRIDSYTEKVQLATLMADIAIGQNDINDATLKDAIFKMETIINSNLVLEQYERAMLALKQHKFPFAEQYLGQFELPSNSHPTDTEFTNRAIKQISDLVIKVRESKSLIRRIDGYLYNNYSFTNDEAFFKWPHVNYMEEFEDLLSGEATNFVANIYDGLKLNAIKFNEVWLTFKMKNQTVQQAFEEQLGQFSIVMQVVGNSFYRCDKRIYYISLESAVRISYSLGCGKPCKPNEIYSKLKTGDSFLSPYSTWQISLVSKNGNDIDYKRLNRFRNDIVEMRLEGRGQFLDNRGDFVYDTCSDHLDKYYRLDGIQHISQ